MNEEHKNKIRFAHIGKLSGMLGKHHSQETKDRMSLSKIGNTNGFKKGATPWNKGKEIWKNKEHPRGTLGRKFSEEHKRKIGDSHRGEKSYLWKGGITSINLQIRQSQEMKQWRKAVFERDDYTCVWCKDRNGEGKSVFFHADHIKMFAYYPELHFDIDNGQTLCSSCHAWKTKWDNIIYRGKVPELNIIYA